MNMLNNGGQLAVLLVLTVASTSCEMLQPTPWPSPDPLATNVPRFPERSSARLFVNSAKINRTEWKDLPYSGRISLRGTPDPTFDIQADHIILDFTKSSSHLKLRAFYPAGTATIRVDLDDSLFDSISMALYSKQPFSVGLRSYPIGELQFFLDHDDFRIR